MGNARKITQAPFFLDVVPKDENGNPASVDGKPVFGINDDSLATLEVSDDGMSVRVVSKKVTGNAKVSVTADGDLTENVRTIIGVYEWPYVAGDAVTIGLVPREET